MLAAGDVVDVDVKRVEVFGLFCDAGAQEVLVLIPDVSWIASISSCRQFASLGDRLTVKILNVDAERGKVAASIKALHPDPWPSGQLIVGALHQARVVRYIERANRCGNAPGYLVELLPGAYAVLCGGLMLEVGQVCSVRVVAAEFSMRAVRVSPVQN